MSGKLAKVSLKPSLSKLKLIRLLLIRPVTPTTVLMILIRQKDGKNKVFLAGWRISLHLHNLYAYKHLFKRCRRIGRWTISSVDPSSATSDRTRYYARYSQHKEQQTRGFMQWSRKSWSEFSHKQVKNERNWSFGWLVQNRRCRYYQFLDGSVKKSKYWLCWGVDWQALEIFCERKHLCIKG